nr:4-coumarate--CoA ligase [Ramlibacter cellulosilyticus]
MRRFVADLVAGELAHLRRGALPVPQPWAEDLRLDEDLAVDSLELITLAAALAEALHLHESGIEDYLLARRTIGEWTDIAAAGLERFDARLTFRTSGSSGTPKPCPHAVATLQQETAHLATLFAGRRRVLCAVPSHHIYGFLLGVLLPRELGVAADAVVDLRASSPAWLARGAQPGDLVVAHPDFWTAVARAVPQLPAHVVGVSSTAPLAVDTARRLGESGLARLVQVYGASETGGIAWRRSHDDPYTLFPHWRLDADDARSLLRTLPDGAQQPFAPQDALQPVGERQFVLGARHDAAVQVGGINVFPERVRDVLRRHPGVEDVAVRLMRPEEGTRLKAFIVPRSGTAHDDALLADLRTWIERELTPPERPKALRLGPRLPVGPTGKPAEWDLQEGGLRPAA